jgi:hypothetical protein
MDQPANAEKQRLRIAHGSFEVIEPSRAFLRPGIATGIDSLRRPLLSVSWAASTVFRYVTPRGPTHDGGSIIKRPEPGPKPTILPRQKPLNRRRDTELKFRTRVYQSR